MTSATKVQLNRRASIIAGQIKALRQAVDEEAYCMDILTQSLAIQKSLASLSKQVVHRHISTHIQQMLSSGDESERQQAMDELAQLYELNNIRGR